MDSLRPVTLSSCQIPTGCEWFQVVVNGPGGIAGGFGWMAFGGCGWFLVVSGGAVWLHVVCCFSSYEVTRAR